MDFFDVLSLVCGLSLFLFGMELMSKALMCRAGGRFGRLLSRMADHKAAGLAMGIIVTAAIQSSSAATVMVVGLVNAGLMNLRQAVPVIMGANIGTTVTAWILSFAEAGGGKFFTGINGGGAFLKMTQMSFLMPTMGLAGVILYLFCKELKKKSIGMVLTGLAVLLFGMETMADAVSGLADSPAFQSLFLVFKNPLYGAFAGAVLTAVIQSSSASVGILQALAITGQVTYGAAIPIIMGQNIGTCITAILSAVGANRNAKRAALVHLSFNVIGTVVWLPVFCVVKVLFSPMFLDAPASVSGIAVSHTVFNVLCVAVLFPLSGYLERLVLKFKL